MQAPRFALAAVLLLFSFAGNAADLTLREPDCATILERWAQDPDSVPKRLVDACKEQMTEAPAPEPEPAALAAELVDPCAGPDAASSVLCWGPWSALAPAAAGPLASLEVPDFPGDCKTGSDIDDLCVAQLEPLEPDPPVEPCEAGGPCGFATLVDGLTSNGDVENTSFRRFDLAGDGSRFTVDPDGADEIESVDMTIISFDPRGDGFEDMRSRGNSGDQNSRLIARVVRDEESGDVLLAADIWTDGNRSDGSLNKSGYFAWGVATSQSGLGLLNGNATSVAFSGPMSVDKGTAAVLTVDFGSQPAWSGTWTNPAWSFGAGGPVNGVNLVSSTSQFTSNVQSESVVQGALLGEPGRLGIAHLIDVNLTGQGRIKDVGLLRQAANGPGVRESVSP